MEKISAGKFHLNLPLASRHSITSSASNWIGSCRRPSRLATTSVEKELTPVALPPGRARLATSPNLTGSSPTAKRLGSSRSQLWLPVHLSGKRASRSRLHDGG